MKIVVCVKHVPDVQSERRLEDERLVRGEDDVLNELDENAVEAAVSLVEEHDGEVVALSMGPQDAEEGLRRALQWGQIVPFWSAMRRWLVPTWSLPPAYWLRQLKNR